MPATYNFESFMAIATSNGNSSATVVLSKDGERFEKTSLGDGPVDSAIKAVNLICGRDFVLDDYTIHSVTEGEDALGEVTVKISNGGEKYVGRGISTDIIEGSIKAYLNGINKLLNDE
jgi:2-isopropylmalate synthase